MLPETECYFSTQSAYKTASFEWQYQSGSRETRQNESVVIPSPQCGISELLYKLLQYEKEEIKFCKRR